MVWDGFRHSKWLRLGDGLLHFAEPCQGYRDENHRRSAAATDQGLGTGLRLHDASQDPRLGLPSNTGDTGQGRMRVQVYWHGICNVFNSATFLARTWSWNLLKQTRPHCCSLEHLGARVARLRNSLKCQGRTLSHFHRYDPRQSLVLAGQTAKTASSPARRYIEADPERKGQTFDLKNN